MIFLGKFDPDKRTGSLPGPQEMQGGEGRFGRPEGSW